jgi:hypothetical protein
MEYVWPPYILHGTFYSPPGRNNGRSKKVEQYFAHVTPEAPKTLPQP